MVLENPDIYIICYIIKIFNSHGGMFQNTIYPWNFIVYGFFVEYLISVHVDSIVYILLLDKNLYPNGQITYTYVTILFGNALSTEH